MQKLTENDRHALAVAREIISGAFVWSDSDEGLDFWLKVDNALADMIGDDFDGHVSSVREAEELVYRSYRQD